MTTSMSIRLLYLGRLKEIAQQIDEALRRELGQIHRDASSRPSLRLVHVTNQKQAMEEIRHAPPNGVVVEVDNGRYNRSRFCNMVQSRIPDVTVVAVHAADLKPTTDFSFSGHICRPFKPKQAEYALHRLINGSSGMYLEVGELRLDVAMRTVRGPQGEHHLPPKLCALLQMLMENVGTTVRREELMQQIWDTKFLGDTRTLDVHVRWLREKIEPDPSNPNYLITIRGQGYRLEESQMETA